MPWHSNLSCHLAKWRDSPYLALPSLVRSMQPWVPPFDATEERPVRRQKVPFDTSTNKPSVWQLSRDRCARIRENGLDLILAVPIPDLLLSVSGIIAMASLIAAVAAATTTTTSVAAAAGAAGADDDTDDVDDGTMYEKTAGSRPGELLIFNQRLCIVFYHSRKYCRRGRCISRDSQGVAVSLCWKKVRRCRSMLLEECSDEKKEVSWSSCGWNLQTRVLVEHQWSYTPAQLYWFQCSFPNFFQEFNNPF